jgi:hypothetical protein
MEKISTLHINKTNKLSRSDLLTRNLTTPERDNSLVKPAGLTRKCQNTKDTIGDRNK